MASVLVCIPATLLALLPAMTAMAAPADWHAVDPEVLERTRGGFTTPEGLQVSVGIERLVTINGEVVSRTRFEANDLRAINGGERALGLSPTSDVGRLIQNGAGNIFMGSLDHPGATVIQNTLNDQSISTQTLINASVNSGAMLKDLNFQGSVRDAAIYATGSR